MKYKVKVIEIAKSFQWVEVEASNKQHAQEIALRECRPFNFIKIDSEEVYSDIKDVMELI